MKINRDDLSDAEDLLSRARILNDDAIVFARNSGDILEALKNLAGASQRQNAAIENLFSAMSEEDIINLKHDVQRHDGDLDQQFKQIQELRQEISNLKTDNDQLKEDLQNTARLAYNIYMYLGRGNASDHAVKIRDKIRSLFGSLHKYLGV